MQETNQPEPGGLTKTDRLIALTDGLFATVLTILVLEIGAPGPDPLWSTGQFINYLAKLSTSSLLSYVLTFLVAASYWQAHHRFFDFIPRTNQRLIWYNLMFLLCIGLLPFATNLVGTRLNLITWTAYCINIVLVGFTFTGECAYAATHGLFVREIDSRWTWHFYLQSLLTPGVFVASLVIAQIDLRVAAFFPILIIIGRIAINRIIPIDRPAPSPVVAPKRRAIREFFWSVLLFSPLFLFAYWLIWLSNRAPAVK